MFGSARDDWETPKELFEEWNKEFGFTVDVCASEANCKIKNYYSKEQNGLKQEWKGIAWCNPPYGREIGKWVKKASESKCTTVMLLPARTDTKWFHKYIYGKAEIRFLKGRIKFAGATENAPFPNMLVVFRGSDEDNS